MIARHQSKKNSLTIREKNLRNFLILTAILIGIPVSGLTFPSASASSSTPTITVLPPAAPVQTPITVTGTGLTPGATVDLYWYGFILDVPGVSGHLGEYPIKTGIVVGSDGTFTTNIITPYDFGGSFVHTISATQNGVGIGIINATFNIAPSLHLAPDPPYTDGQEVILHVYGAPGGFQAPGPRGPEVLKFTYDNNMWGYLTSHLTTEGPIVTLPDLGGNATVRFKAVGGPGEHVIRGYEGEKDTPPYLPCEIGGEVTFTIAGPTSSEISDAIDALARDISSGTTYTLGTLALALIAVILIIANLAYTSSVKKKLEKA